MIFEDTRDLQSQYYCMAPQIGSTLACFLSLLYVKMSRSKGICGLQRDQSVMTWQIG